LPSARRIRVCLSAAHVNSSDPFLYHKTTQRAVYEEALATRPGFDDVILWNERGEITESSIANIVVDLDGELFTPPVNCGLLAGTYRAHLLELGVVAERVITVQELSRCSAVYLINSVRRMWKVAVEAGHCASTLLLR
jgi:para-aminobenzoate synthetase / 4-amino-4-deoxychorismate lyase